MTTAAEIQPLNEDKQDLFWIGQLHILDLEDAADVIANVINADPNEIITGDWRNVSITMRAGSWAALFQRDVL